jgi:hypothetical protein
MKNWIKENWFKAGLLFAILVVGVSTSYYYAIFLPQKERARVDQQQQSILAQELRE